MCWIRGGTEIDAVEANEASKHSLEKNSSKRVKKYAERATGDSIEQFTIAPENDSDNGVNGRRDLFFFGCEFIFYHRPIHDRIRSSPTNVHHLTFVCRIFDVILVCHRMEHIKTHTHTYTHTRTLGMR